MEEEGWQGTPHALHAGIEQVQFRLRRSIVPRILRGLYRILSAKAATGIGMAGCLEGLTTLTFWSCCDGLSMSIQGSCRELA